ncbi:MAG: YihY/virulence factor BrkB family protein [Bacteroidota bacterium]
MLERLRQTLSNTRDAAVFYGRGLLSELQVKPIFLYAQAIAFKVLITILPVILLATGVLGQVLQRERPFETVKSFLRDFLPAYQSDQIIEFLAKLQNAGDTLTLIGGVALLVSAMTLFTTLRLALRSIFSEDWHRPRDLLRGYLFDFQMVAQVGLMFVLTFAVTLTMQALNGWGGGLLDSVGLPSEWLTRGWKQAVSLVGLLVPLLLTSVMFFQLFWLTPRPRIPKRSAFFGAVFSAVLWEMGKGAFTFYATNIGRFDRYGGEGAEDGIAVLGDTFGLILAFVVWAYFSGAVLMLGAVVALLHEKRMRLLNPTRFGLPDEEEEGASSKPPGDAETQTEDERQCEDTRSTEHAAEAASTPAV